MFPALTDTPSPAISRKFVNGEVRQSPSQDSSNPTSADAGDSGAPMKKAGPSARRGKIQREKRMLRQKRRSTGVVNIKDVEGDENVKDSNEVSLHENLDSCCLF